VDNGDDSTQIVRFGIYEADLQSGELRKKGHKVPLQGQPFQVFAILLQHSGKLVTREELRQKVWPEDTFVDFDHGLNTAITKIRTALEDSAENPRFVETMPRRGYRFIVPVDSHSQSGVVPVRGSRIKWVVIAAVSSFALLATAGYFYFHRAPKLTDKDTIVLSDFDNKTGDPVFDGTLRQGLAVQLEQSPFLVLVSDQLIQQTLRLMGQSSATKLTPEISREVCQRTGSKAVIDGSIAQIGPQYSLILKAVNCSSGESFTSTEVQASDKSHILDALGKAASEIRNKLGESLSTVQKFDTPLPQATTPSLEALQAYSLGQKAGVEKNDSAAAVHLFQQAIRLDPNFAMAYVHLGACYTNLGETSLAYASTKKAYELRDRVSEREKLNIEGRYYVDVRRNLEKVRQVYELLAQLYPRDWAPHNMLGHYYVGQGQYEKVLEQWREALRLDVNGMSYANLVQAYLNLNRLDEARATAEEAQAKKLDSRDLDEELYFLAFLQNDTAGMQQQVDRAVGKPGVENVMLFLEAGTAGYSGQNAKAREFSNRAITSAEQVEEKEAAATYEAEAAVREALFGNAIETRWRATAALALSRGRKVQKRAGLALAMAGNSAQAQTLADDLAKRFPEDCIVQFNDLPTLHAQLALRRNDASKAIEVLQAASPYELGGMSGFDLSSALYPVYVRGVAYLARHQGSEAAVEFQKILDHRGVVLNQPTGALAHLGLARAYVLQGDTAKARAAYQDFLTLWKDADPDIPILIAAKAEYAKLR
jgi:eukaryotic-like serine/threonine-protein kinase